MITTTKKAKTIWLHDHLGVTGIRARTARALYAAADAGGVIQADDLGASMTPAEIRAAMEAHAIACRVAIAELRPRPEMPRDLADANLTGANLAGGRNVHGAAPLDGSGAAFSSRSQR